MVNEDKHFGRLVNTDIHRPQPGSQPMGRDPNLARLQMFLCRLFFCKHLQRVRPAESNNKINARPLQSSHPLLHFCDRKTPAAKFLTSGDRKIVKRFDVANDIL